MFRTNHTSFTVSNLKDLIEYFCEVLGFTLLSHAPRDQKTIEKISGVKGADIMVAFLQGPGHRIELIQYIGPDNCDKVECRPCDSGFAHIAYDVDDVDAAISASAPYSFLPIAEPVSIDQGPNKGCRVVYLRNEGGVNIEFIEKTN